MGVPWGSMGCHGGAVGVPLGVLGGPAESHGVPGGAMGVSWGVLGYPGVSWGSCGVPWGCCGGPSRVLWGSRGVSWGSCGIPGGALGVPRDPWGSHRIPGGPVGVPRDPWGCPGGVPGVPSGRARGGAPRSGPGVRLGRGGRNHVTPPRPPGGAARPSAALRHFPPPPGAGSGPPLRASPSAFGCASGNSGAARVRPEAFGPCRAVGAGAVAGGPRRSLLWPGRRCPPAARDGGLRSAQLRAPPAQAAAPRPARRLPAGPQAEGGAEGGG